MINLRILGELSHTFSPEMILTISIAETELEKAVGLEQQLRELAIDVKEVNHTKRFIPQPGRLVQFINLVATYGVTYIVDGEVHR